MVRVRGQLGIGKAEAKDCWAAWGPPEFGDSEGTNMPERPHQGSSVTDELEEASGEPTPSEGEQGVEGQRASGLTAPKGEKKNGDV